MNPLPGRVYLDHNFPLRSGGIGPKFMVVLCNYPGNFDYFLLARATSKQRCPAVEGCHLDRPECFYIPDEKTPLDGETRIMLDEIHPADFDGLKKHCKYIGQLDDILTSNLLRCAAKSCGIEGLIREELENSAQDIQAAYRTC